MCMFVLTVYGQDTGLGLYALHSKLCCVFRRDSLLILYLSCAVLCGAISCLAHPALSLLLPIYCFYDKVAASALCFTYLFAVVVVVIRVIGAFVCDFLFAIAISVAVIPINGRS